MAPFRGLLAVCDLMAPRVRWVRVSDLLFDDNGRKGRKHNDRAVCSPSSSAALKYLPQHPNPFLLTREFVAGD
jgi:hypothetical protein